MIKLSQKGYKDNKEFSILLLNKIKNWKWIYFNYDPLEDWARLMGYELGDIEFYDKISSHLLPKEFNKNS